MRLGLLTGGGDCPGLNAVIRAAVVHTVRTHESQIVGFLDGWKGLLEGHVRELSLESIGGILPRGGTILGTSRVNPLKPPMGGLDRLRDAFHLFRLDGLLVCGGDGTLSAAHAISREGLPIIGIPKTIDNDVPGTDYAFGFDTALRHVVDAIDALHSTAESHDRVLVLEVMGRTAGWIAACAAIAGGADVAITPEDPMSVQQVVDVIRQRRARGRMFSIVVVAEGAAFLPDPDGSRLETPHQLDEFGRPRFGGVGDLLAQELEARTHMETRTVKLGYVQRGGTPSPFDRLLGSRMGVHAVDLAARRQYGCMVALKGLDITSVPLSVVEQGARLATPELLATARVFYG
jgi:6-phosphofructokinase 1